MHRASWGGLELVRVPSNTTARSSWTFAVLRLRIHAIRPCLHHANYHPIESDCISLEECKNHPFESRALESIHDSPEHRQASAAAVHEGGRSGQCGGKGRVVACLFQRKGERIVGKVLLVIHALSKASVCVDKKSASKRLGPSSGL